MRIRTVTVVSLFALLATALLFFMGDAATTVETRSTHATVWVEIVPSEQNTSGVRTSIEDPVEVTGLYGAPVGSRFTFGFRHETEYSIETLAEHSDDFVPSQGEPVTIPVLGRLHVQIIAGDEQTITLLMQGTKITTPVAGKPNQRGEASLRAYRTALESWFLVRIDPRGAILGYAFQEGPRATERNFIRSFVAAFLHSADESKTEWQSIGQDATGDYLANYRKVASDPVTIERRKLRYTKIGREAVVPTHEVSGRSRACFEGGFILSVTADETMQLEIAEFPSRVHVRVKAQLKRIESTWTGVELDPSQWPAFLAASGALENLAANSIANDEQRWRDLLADVSVETLIEALRAELDDTRSSEFYAAWERLHWKLALDEKSVAEVQAALLNGSLEERLGSMVLSALGKAGSDEAQDALLAVYGSEHLSAGWREAATIAMFQLQKPSGAVIETVAAGLKDLRQIDQHDATSMLLFGTIAPRRAEPMANGRTALQQLLSMESRSRDLQASGLWLDALGNAAVPAVATHAARYLSHDDALVRESAVVAMDRSGAADIATRLIPLAEKDSSRDVRVRAIEALGKRDDARGRAAIQRLAIADKDVEVRRAAIRALAGRKVLATTDRQTLERVVRQDTNADVRAAAQRLLDGRR